MAAHRYWRAWLYNARSSDNFYSIAEWHMATAIGGANVIAGGTGSFIGTLWSGTFANVLDGNATTYLIIDGRGNGQESITYDFGAGNEKDIVEVGFQCRADGFSYQSPSDGALAYSDDGITWTLSFSWSVGEWTYVSEMRKFIANAEAAARFSWWYKTLSVKLTTSTRLLATFTAVSTVALNKGVTGLSYGEFTITTLTGTPAIGMVNDFYNYAVGTLLGADANSLGYRSGGGVVANGVTLTTLAAFAAGDRVDVAFNPFIQRIWFRVNGGNWNNSALNDPATGVGGIDTSSIAGLDRFACGASITGTAITAAFDTLVGTAPTGFLSPTTNQVAKGQKDAASRSSVDTPGTGDRGVDTPAFRSNRLFTPSGTITKVSGLTKENGVLIAGKRVDVYDRNTGELLDTTVSNGIGYWEAVALGRPAVRVVGSDPTTYNSIVYDNVVPA